MKIWTPNQNAKQPCHRNGYLQSAADVRTRRNRFRLNPLARVGSILVPQPLRFAGGRRRCCCGIDCLPCTTCPSTVGFAVTLSAFDEVKCPGYNDTFIVDCWSEEACVWSSAFQDVNIRLSVFFDPDMEVSLYTEADAGPGVEEFPWECAGRTGIPCMNWAAFETENCVYVDHLMTKAHLIEPTCTELSTLNFVFGPAEDQVCHITRLV